MSVTGSAQFSNWRMPSSANRARRRSDRRSAFLIAGTTGKDGVRRIEVTANTEGYKPDKIMGKPGEKLTLVFTRTSDKGCNVDVHFTLPDGSRVDEQLPLGQPVEIPIAVEKPGEITYSCGMNMDHGTIVVK